MADQVVAPVLSHSFQNSSTRSDALNFGMSASTEMATCVQGVIYD